MCIRDSTMLLLLLYFTDYKGAFAASAAFAGCTTVFTLLSLLFPQVYYGFGFLLGSAVFFLITALRLGYFTQRLPYYCLLYTSEISRRIRRQPAFGTAHFLSRYIQIGDSASCGFGMIFTASWRKNL